MLVRWNDVDCDGIVGGRCRRVLSWDLVQKLGQEKAPSRHNGNINGVVDIRHRRPQTGRYRQWWERALEWRDVFEILLAPAHHQKPSRKEQWTMYLQTLAFSASTAVSGLFVGYGMFS